MRFIKRLVFVIILLLIAFFIYRLINPTAAKELLLDLKTFSNDNIGTHFSLSGEILETTGAVLNLTGAIVEETGAMQEFTGDEELLLNDMELPENIPSTVEETGIVSKTPCPAMPTVSSCPTGQEKYVSYSSPECGTYYACKAKTTTTAPKTTTTPEGLSSQDILDLKTLFGN